MPPDTQNNKEQLNGPEKVDVSRAPLDVSVLLRGMQRSLGERKDVPSSGAGLRAEHDSYAVDQKMVLNDYRDLCRYNEILARIKALQLAALPIQTKASKEELVLANRTATFYEYLPSIADQLSGVMESYDRDLADMLPSLSPNERAQCAKEREQVVAYMQTVKQLIDERLHLANIGRMTALMDTLRDKPALRAEYERVSEARTALLAGLRPDSRKAYEAYLLASERYGQEQNPAKKISIITDAKKAYGDFLQSVDQKLIDVLKGNPDEKEIDGSPPDFLPQKAYIRLLQVRYTHLHAVQSDIARSPLWTEDQRKAAQTELGPIRRDALRRLVMLTQSLAGYQISAAELTAFQNQFGPSDATGQFLPTSQSSPAHVKERFEEVLEGTPAKPGAKHFHLQSLQAMLSKVDTAFSPNGLEGLSDAAAMEFVRNVDSLSGGIQSLLTGWMPDSEAKDELDAWFRTELPLSIRESLESGVNKDGTPMTKEQKLIAMRDVIIAFRDKGSVAQLRSSLSLLQALPPSADFVGQEPQQEVLESLQGKRFDSDPTGTVVSLAGGQSISINGATAYVLLFRQMDADADAFQNDYKDFLNNMDDLVDLRLGLIAEVNDIAGNWAKVATVLAATAGIGLGVSTVAPFILPRVPGWTAKAIEAGYKGVRTPQAPLVALQAARTYLDYREWESLRKQTELEHARMSAELLAAGFVAVPQGQNQTFVYEEGGVSVKVNVGEISQTLQEKANAQGIRTGVSAAEVAYLLYAMRRGMTVAKSVTPLVVVDVAVETYMYSADQAANRRFIERCPAWLLAKLDLQSATKDSPYGHMASASEWMISDHLMVGAPEQNKKEIREKMIFVLLEQELRLFPDLAVTLHPAGTDPVSIEGFMKGEFRDVFLKFYHVRIFQCSDGQLTWDQVKEGRIAGFNALPGRTPEIAEIEVRRAIREAGLLTAQHVAERAYCDALKERDAYAKQKERDPRIVALLDERVHAAGEVIVLGRPLSEVSVQTYLTGGSRMQRVADLLFAQAPNGDYSLDTKDIEGLTAGMDFSDPSRVLESALPPGALRLNLLNLQPRTVGEKEQKLLDAALPSVPYHLRSVTAEAMETWSKSVYENTVMGAYGNVDRPRSFAFAAADAVRRVLGKNLVSPEPTLQAALLGASSDERSLEELQGMITSDVTELFATDGRLQQSRTDFMRRNEAWEFARELGGSLPSSPLIFEAGSPSPKLCAHLLSEIQSERVRKEIGPLLAVSFEATRVQGNEVVLATFVCGDFDKKEFVIARQAIVTSSVVRFGTVPTRGRLQFVTEKTSDAAALIARMAEGMKQREVRVQDRKMESSRVQREQESRWIAQRPERDRLERVRSLERDAAIAKSRQSNVLTFVPGAYERNESLKMFQEAQGTFRARVEGYDVEVILPEYPERPSMRAVTKTSGVRVPSETDLFTFSASKDGKSKEYAISLSTILSPSQDLSPAEMRMCQSLLSSAMDLSAHPLAKDAKFEAYVRRSELKRVLDTVTFKSSWNWTAEQVKTNLFMELSPLYIGATDKQKFMKTLVEELLKEQKNDGSVWTGIREGSYGRLIRAMKEVK